MSGSVQFVCNSFDIRQIEKIQSIHITRDQYFRENEHSIRIPLCNARHLNGMLHIPLLEIFPKNTHQLKKKKKIQNTWETLAVPEILNAVM